MNPLDDLFRDGLGGRKGEIPADMWSRVNAARTPFTPEGEGVDQYFSDALKHHKGEVPADMWSRISAGGIPVPATLDQTFADGLRDLTGPVPIGMWDKIWRARTATKFPVAARWAAAASIVLLLLAGLWLLDRQVNTAQPTNATATSMPTFTDEEVAITMPAVNGKEVGGAAGAKNGEGASQPASASTTTTTTTTPTAGPATTPKRSPATTADENPGSVAAPLVKVVPAATPVVAAPAAPVPTSTTASAVPASEVGNRASLRAAIPAATPALSFAPQALEALLIEAPTIAVKKQYLPRRDELSATPFRAAARHRLKAEFLFGAFYANQQFTATAPDQVIPRELRNLNENPDLSYQVTLRGSYNLSQRFHLLGGLTYAEIRNEFSYTQLVGGVTSDIRTTNRLRMLEAPLLLGLRMPGRRVMVSLNAGPVVNLAFSARGRFIDPDAPQPLDLAAAGNYRRNVGVGLMSSLSINYKVGRKDPFVLTVEPFFKGYPTSFTVKDAPLRESYWVAGVQIGVRKGF